MHGGEFSFLTGEALSFPAMKPIAHYNTRRVGDMIELDWPAPEDSILPKKD
jgi:nitrite reductase/ring-hydroxylating ferredoxin subunit